MQLSYYDQFKITDQPRTAKRKITRNAGIRIQTKSQLAKQNAVLHPINDCHTHSRIQTGVGGNSDNVFVLVDEGREDPNTAKTGHHRPTSETSFK